MYTVGLARTYRGILYKFFEIGIKYGPPACGRRSILKTQFLRIYTVFPDHSSFEREKTVNEFLLGLWICFRAYGWLLSWPRWKFLLWKYCNQVALQSFFQKETEIKNKKNSSLKKPFVTPFEIHYPLTCIMAWWISKIYISEYDFYLGQLNNHP